MTPLIDDPDFTLYVGDVRDVLRELEPESVHCTVTSPPYWGLRDYVELSPEYAALAARRLQQLSLLA